MPAGPLLEREAAVRPGDVVERVDAVELHPAGLDQVRDRADHAVVLVVPGPALLAREHQRPAGRSGRSGSRCPARSKPGMSSSHWSRARIMLHTFRSRSVRCGSSRSRQQVQVWPCRTSPHVDVEPDRGQVVAHQHGCWRGSPPPSRTSSRPSGASGAALGSREHGWRRSRSPRPRTRSPTPAGRASGVKNDPDCSISPANVPGLVHAACSAASAAEALPDEHRPVVARARGQQRGHARGRSSAAAYAGLAEYRSLRGPGCQQRDPHPRQLAGGDQRADAVEQPAVRRHLGPVVGASASAAARRRRRRPAPRP